MNVMIKQIICISVKHFQDVSGVCDLLTQQTFQIGLSVNVYDNPKLPRTLKLKLNQEKKIMSQYERKSELG